MAGGDTGQEGESMGIISEGLKHNQRCHAAMMGGVTARERFALLSPMAEQERKVEMVRELIAARKAERGYKIQDEPDRDDGFVAFCWCLTGIIVTAILVLGAWIRFGG